MAQQCVGLERVEDTLGKNDKRGKKKNQGTITLKIFSDKVSREKSDENIVGKGENVGYQHFLLFSHCVFSCLFPPATLSYFGGGCLI